MNRNRFWWLASVACSALALLPAGCATRNILGADKRVDLAITKQALDTPWQAGGKGNSYAISVHNLGPRAVPAGSVITVTDLILEGQTVTSASGSGWTCTPSAGAGPLAISCTHAVPAGGLAPATLDPITIAVDVTRAPPAPLDGFFSNCAMVQATLAGAVLPDSKPSNNESCGWSLDPCQGRPMPTGLEGEWDWPKVPTLSPGTVQESDVDMVTGNVHTLYPGHDTTLDNWYGTAPDVVNCMTIGGTAPQPTDMRDPYKDFADQTGVSITPRTIDNILQAEDYAVKEASSVYGPRLANLPQILSKPGLVMTGPYVPKQCRDHLDHLVPCRTLLPKESPFAGRDIIFVHGLNYDAIVAKIVGTDPGALTTWPADASEFYGPAGSLTAGWWKQQASEPWLCRSTTSAFCSAKPQGSSEDNNHFDHFLKARNAKNRYLVAGYPSTQNLPFAIHAILTQIAKAMTTGHDVQLLNPSDPRGTTGFCDPDCVIITHSTGGLVVDTAMAVAAHPVLGLLLGNIGWIPQRMKVHVSITGAHSGSNLALAAISVSLGVKFGVPSLTGVEGCAVALLVLKHLSATTLLSCTQLTQVLLQSILLDLVPAVSHLWEDGFPSPVPTVLVSGGHVSENFPLGLLLLAGFDDGVLTSDSACGKLTLPGTEPSGFYARPAIFSLTPLLNPKLYDMGMNGARAVPYFFNQGSRAFTPTLNLAAAGCIPYKTPWGMVEPYLASAWPFPMYYRAGHYPFIQSSADHSGARRGAPYDSWGEHNPEETRTLVHSYLYSSGLVDSAMQTNQEEVVKGKSVKFPPIKLPVGVKCCPLKLKWKEFTLPPIWIWKRTYHYLKGWQTKMPMDYVYDYVANKP